MLHSLCGGQLPSGLATSARRARRGAANTSEPTSLGFGMHLAVYLPCIRTAKRQNSRYRRIGHQDRRSRSHPVLADLIKIRTLRRSTIPVRLDPGDSTRGRYACIGRKSVRSAIVRTQVELSERVQRQPVKTQMRLATCNVVPIDLREHVMLKAVNERFLIPKTVLYDEEIPPTF